MSKENIIENSIKIFDKAGGGCYNYTYRKKSMEEDIREAAAQGFAAAQCYLGVCYLKGDGLGQSDGKAAFLFREAAELGSVDAQYWLGTCYAKGMGVEKNPMYALYWWKMAASGGEMPREE